MEAVVQDAIIDVGALTRGLKEIKKGLRRVVGCWHLEMSLPFTRDNETYRTCITCGARRRFDLEQWTMVGDFYHRHR
jgi:hypothetical protein